MQVEVEDVVVANANADDQSSEHGDLCDSGGVATVAWCDRKNRDLCSEPGHTELTSRPDDSFHEDVQHDVLTDELAAALMLMCERVASRSLARRLSDTFRRYVSELHNSTYAERAAIRSRILVLAKQASCNPSRPA